MCLRYLFSSAFARYPSRRFYRNTSIYHGGKRRNYLFAYLQKLFFSVEANEFVNEKIQKLCWLKIWIINMSLCHDFFTSVCIKLVYELHFFTLLSEFFVFFFTFWSVSRFRFFAWWQYFFQLSIIQSNRVHLSSFNIAHRVSIGWLRWSRFAALLMHVLCSR